MPRSSAKILPAQLERRVYERLRDEILGGAMPPGQQLVEARLAAELGVSKTPVREALIRLQRDGLVEIEPYRGARVIEPSEDDVREILDLRLLLECHIARDLARRQPPEALAALARSIEGSRQALERGQKQRVRDALTEFSDVMAETNGNSRLRAILAGLRSVLLLIGSSSLRVPGREERSIEEHARILAAIEDGDEEAAAEATAEHIRSIERDSVGASSARVGVER